MSSPNPLEVVQNLILDTLEPFIDRLEALEQHVNVVAQGVDALSVQVPRDPETARNDLADVETPQSTPNGATVLPAAVEEILALHRLDATPMQWVFQDGKQQQAPEGMWEITCSVCADHKIDWRQGDPEPPRCKTVKILTRGY